MTNLIISAVLTLLSGIGIFLIACQMMSTNLESVASKSLKNWFSKAAKSKLLGIGIGTLGTAAIQSSGATTVMIIGFVNAGIMSLSQAATVIYGANIGTTITAQIVALGMFSSQSSISTTVIFSTFAGIGALISLFAKNNGTKRLGGILTGFGMLFVGLSIMSKSMEAFASLESVRLFLSQIKNPLLVVGVGIIMTAIIQSSSVVTSISIAMLCTGLISLDQGIYLTMGSNVGSCVVAIFAGLTSGTNAKRTALIHLIFNILGVVIFLIIGSLLKLGSGHGFGDIFQDLFPSVPQIQLAMFHTIFNISTVVIILPLTSFLVNFVSKLIKDNEVKTDGPRLYFIDNNMLKTPPVAVAQLKNEIVNMAKIAMNNVNLALDIITDVNFARIDEFNKNETELDFLNSSMLAFVVKLLEQPQLSETDHVYLSTTFRTIRDLERIGDYGENITEYTRVLEKEKSAFSSQAIVEISELRDLMKGLYRCVIDTYVNEDINSLERSYYIEEKIDDYTKSMEENHIARLSAGKCSVTVGAQYLSLSSNLERIADHFINMAKTIKELRVQR